MASRAVGGGNLAGIALAAGSVVPGCIFGVITQRESGRIALLRSSPGRLRGYTFAADDIPAALLPSPARADVAEVALEEFTPSSPGSLLGLVLVPLTPRALLIPISGASACSIVWIAAPRDARLNADQIERLRPLAVSAVAALDPSARPQEELAGPWQFADDAIAVRLFSADRNTRTDEERQLFVDSCDFEIADAAGESLLRVPIRIEREAAGILTVSSRTTAFDMAAVALARRLAEYIGFALSNRNLAEAWILVLVVDLAYVLWGASRANGPFVALNCAALPENRSAAIRPPSQRIAARSRMLRSSRTFPGQ